MTQDTRPTSTGAAPDTGASSGGPAESPAKAASPAPVPTGKAGGGRQRFTKAELGVIVEAYALAPVRDVKEFRAGDPRAPKAVIDATITIDGEKKPGRVLLKRRAPGAASDPFRVAFTHDVQLCAERAGLPTPPLLGTAETNNSMVQIDTRVYELFGYVNASPATPSPATGEATGRAVAQFAAALREHTPAFGAPTEPDYDAVLEDGARRLRRAFVNDAAAGASLDRLLAEARRAGEKLQSFDLGPARITHGDWHPGNLLFDADGDLAAVVDFDAAAMGTDAEQLAQALTQWSIARDRQSPASWPEAPEGMVLDAVFSGWIAGGGAVSGELCAAMPRLMVRTLALEAVGRRAVSAWFGTGDAPGPDLLATVARKAVWLDRNANTLTSRFAEIARTHRPDVEPTP